MRILLQLHEIECVTMLWTDDSSMFSRIYLLQSYHRTLVPSEIQVDRQFTLAVTRRLVSLLLAEINPIE